MRDELLPPVNSVGQLKSLCRSNKSMVVLFWLDNSSASVLFKDCMTYHQGKLSMQPGKYMPHVAQAKYSDSASFRELSRHSSVTEYPTLILFDGEANPIRTVIGFSWF